MNNDSEQMYILIQNIESAYFRIAKARQSLLDNQYFEEWRELVLASGTLNSAIERCAELMGQEQQLNVGDKGDLNT